MKEDINLNLYKTFYEVAKSGSISIASKNLYVSQPALSKSIKTLEDALDTKLFYRTISGMVLTQKGLDLYKCVEESFKILRYAETKMIETENLEKGSLTIGAPSHIISFFLLDKIYDFHKKYANIDITIISRPSKELLKMLNNNEIDFVIDITSYEDDLDNFTIKKIENLKHCFVMSSELNCLNDKKIYSIADLSDVPLILPVFNSSHRKKLNALASEKNIKFNNVISIETSEIIYNTIKNNLGVGYILYDIVKNDIKKGKMKRIKIKEKLPEVSLNLIYKEKILSLVSQKFIDDFLLNTIEKDQVLI